MITGLRPETFENLQLNAGVFLRNFDYSKIEDVEQLEDAILAALEESGDKILGATIGGGSFQCTPTIRNIEADGMRYPIIGSTVKQRCRHTDTPFNIVRCTRNLRVCFHVTRLHIDHDIE